MIRMIVAPSGAGKSFHAKLGLLTDGDHLPLVADAYKSLDTLHGKRWWMLSEYDKDIKPHKERWLLAAFKQSFPNRWGTEIPPVATAEMGVAVELVRQGLLLPDEILVWIPTPETLTARQAVRNSDSQPLQGVEKNKEWANFFEGIARGRGFQLHKGDDLPSFFDAPEDVRYFLIDRVCAIVHESGHVRFRLAFPRKDEWARFKYRAGVRPQGREVWFVEFPHAGILVVQPYDEIESMPRSRAAHVMKLMQREGFIVKSMDSVTYFSLKGRD